MKSYDALAEVNEWLIADAKLAPAAFVGLIGRGIQVVATDASEAMVRRTAVLSEEFRASVRTVRADWQELPDELAGTRAGAWAGSALGTFSKEGVRELRGRATCLGGRAQPGSPSMVWENGRRARVGVVSQYERAATGRGD